MQPLVSILIATYNRLDLVQQCIARVFELANNEPSAEVIVVDNASSDGTSEWLAICPHEIVLIRNRENRNFAAANNQAAALARGKYLIMLNADTLPEPGWLQGLVDAMQRHPNAGVIGCKLLYPETRKVQHAGVVYFQGGHPYHIYRNTPETVREVNYEREFQTVTAACWIVEAAQYRALGGFDERFRNGFEDVDYCLRTREAGKEVWYTPHSVVLHFEESSPGRHDNNRYNWTILESRWSMKVDPDWALRYAEDGWRAIDVAFGHIRLQPAEPVLQLEIERIRIQFFKGDFASAYQRIDELAREHSDSEAIVELLIERDRERGDINSAATRAIEWSKRFPSFRSGFQAATLLKRANRIEEAQDMLAHLKAMCETDRDRARMICLRGDLELKQGRLEEADRCYREANQLDSKLLDPLIGQTNILLMQGDTARAKVEYEKILDHDPETTRAFLGLALVYQAEGNTGRALQEYGRALHYDPSDKQAMYSCVAFAKSVGEFELAEIQLMKFIQRCPEDADLWLAVTAVRKSRGDQRGAISAVERAYQLRPHDEFTLQLRSELSPANAR